MAIEDAVVLARCLERCVRPGEGLRIYERIRSSRTAALARYSRLYGTIGQWENGTAVFLRRNLISLLPEYLMQRALRLIFEYDAYAVAIP